MFNITSAYFCKHNFCFCTINNTRHLTISFEENLFDVFLLFFFKEIVLHLVPFLPLIAVLKYLFMICSGFLSLSAIAAPKISPVGRLYVCLSVLLSACPSVPPSVYKNCTFYRLLYKQWVNSNQTSYKASLLRKTIYKTGIYIKK